MSKYKSFQEYWDSLDYDLPSVAANSAYDAAKAAWEATDAPLLAEQNEKMLIFTRACTYLNEPLVSRDAKALIAEIEEG